MRWLIVLAIVVSASTASARRLVISDPPMVRKCPRAKTWPLVMQCLAKHATPKVSREVKGAKLVTLMQKSSGGKLIDHGVLLYVERNGQWQIGGRFETYGGEYAVLGFAPLTIGKRTGYRLDIGQVTQTTVMIDAISPVQATQRLHRVMFCSGDSYACPEAQTSCDVSVNGNAWFVFRGNLAFEDNNIATVTGDRERAGGYCGGNPKVYLGWANR